MTMLFDQTLLLAFVLGPAELAIVGIIAVILFGKKLPEVAKQLGGSYREFRKGLNEIQSQVNTIDHYAETSSYASSQSYDDNDDYEEVSAPKFEPPASEPQPKSEPAHADGVNAESPNGETPSTGTPSTGTPSTGTPSTEAADTTRP